MKMRLSHPQYRMGKIRHSKSFCLIAVLFLWSCMGAGAQTGSDPLPSWNKGAVKQQIIDFVDHVSTPGDPEFIAPGSRIAVFDNDGTLWTEKPIYTEFTFVFDRVRVMAPQHPQWQTQEPYAAVLHHDAKALAVAGDRGMFQMLLATHANMTTDQFAAVVTDWIQHAQHPRFHRPYTECVYQPMLEVLELFRAHGFKTYIVSGGEQDFMRPWTEKTYGIPPEQVVGTTLPTEYEIRDGVPLLQKLPKIQSIDDGPGKPENIHMFIGRRPIAAFGNSDGDKQMLEWTAAGAGPHLMVLIHHTDAQREYAYDRKSSVGRLDKALDEANARHWTVVDMKQDWKVIFPAEPTELGVEK